jgi:hypothetical protein
VTARPTFSGSVSSRAARKARTFGWVVKGDEGGDRGEAQLEARADQRVGPEQEDDERARRHQPQRQRLAAERDAAEHQQRGDARAHRRHLGAGEDRVGDPRQRARPGRDEGEAKAQRELRAEGEELQRQQHHRADQSGQVQPADREQVGEAGAPHGVIVRLRDAGLVAVRQGDGDRPLAAAEMGEDVLPQPLPRPRDEGAPSARSAARHDGDVERAAGAADALEIRRAGEIVGAGHRRRRRRHQPRSELYTRARRELRRLFHGNVDAEARRQAGRLDRTQDEPDGVAGGDRLHGFDVGGEGRRLLAGEPRRIDPVRLPPDVGAADDPRQREQRQRLAPARARRKRERQQRQGSRQQQEGDPRPLVWQDEPGRDARAKAHRDPQGKLVPLGVEPGFNPCIRTCTNSTQPTPRAGLSSLLPYARGADVHGRHGSHPWRKRA